MIILLLFLQLTVRGEVSSNYLEEGRLIEKRAEEFFNGDTVKVNSYLKNSGRFRYDERGKIKLSPIIFDIEVSGNYPMLEETIKKNIVFFSGQVYNRSKLKVEEKRLTEFLKSEGFLNPSVRIKEINISENYVSLSIEIEKDDIIPINSIVINNNKAFSDIRLKFMMSSFFRSLYPVPMNRFSENRLKKDVRTIGIFYKEKGFYSSKVSSRDTLVNGSVNIYIDVDEGEDFDIKYEGKDYYYDFTLNNAVEPLLAQSGTRYGMKRGKLRLLEKYKLDGFEDVYIKNRLVDKKDIVYDIDEGERRVIDKFLIKSEGIDTEKLRSLTHSGDEPFFGKNYYSSLQLELDSASIAGYLYSKGFFDNRILIKRDLSEKSANIEIDVFPGKRTMISNIKIDGLEEDNRFYKKIYSKKGDAYVEYIADKDRNLISTYISETGYPYVKAEYNYDSLSSTLNFNIERGSKVRNGKVFFTGNFKTSPKYLISLLEFEEDSLFSLRRLYSNQKKLRSTTIFNNVKIKTPGLLSKLDKIDLFIELSEKHPYFFEFGCNYEVKNRFSADLKFGDKNFMGKNRALYTDLYYSSSKEYYQIFYEDRDLFGTFIKGKFSLFYEDYNPVATEERFYETGVNLTVYRGFNIVTLGFGSSFSKKNSNVYADTDNYLNEYSVFATVDRRSNIMRPKFGYYGNVEIKYSLNFSEDYDKFTKITFDNRYFYTFKKLTIATSLKNGYIYSRFEDKVSTDQKFFLGGLSTVRGYSQNKFITNGSKAVADMSYSLLNFELRLETFFNIETIAFYDLGSLGDYMFKKPKSSTGLGIGYISPFGSITLYYGKKLDRVENEGRYKIHFSIGYVF